MTKVRFKKNDGEIGDEICELIETDDDICRIKRPSGEIIRIFKDRVHDIDEKEPNGQQAEVGGLFDPWDSSTDDCEVWSKSNSFNDTTICETIAILYPGKNVYKSVNTYNGVAKKIMEYPIKNINSLRNKMVRKGYEQLERP